MTAAELFASLPERFRSERAGDLRATYAFELEGDGGGAWTVVVGDGALTVTDGAASDADVTVRAKAADWMAIVDGPHGSPARLPDEEAPGERQPRAGAPPPRGRSLRSLADHRRGRRRRAALGLRPGRSAAPRAAARRRHADVPRRGVGRAGHAPARHAAGAVPIAGRGRHLAHDLSADLSGRSPRRSPRARRSSAAAGSCTAAISRSIASSRLAERRSGAASSAR